MSQPTTSIAFYQRAPEKATPYRWWTRLSDRWAGGRDAAALSPAQVEESARRTGDAPVIPTPWVATRLREVDHVMARERITLERIIDTGLTELATLKAQAENLDKELTRCQRRVKTDP